MATKAIYTKVGNNYFKVIQDVSNPSIIFRMPETHTTMETNPAIKQVQSSIWINPICVNTVQTNKEAYDEMVEYLSFEKITQIDNIQNRFVMYMDYSVYNENGNEVNHNVVSKEVEPIDAMYPLGVGMDSELLYKQIKSFKADLSFSVKNPYPYGIMRNNVKGTMYSMKINDIALYQDLLYGSNFIDKHYSASENCYAYGSHTIDSALRGMKKIFSTYDMGITLAAVEVSFVPRTVMLKIQMACDNTIVVYDDYDIKNIISENLRWKYTTPQPPVIDPDNDVPDGENYPESDGTREPNSEGKYDYYERVTADTQGALLVVEDELSGALYDNYKMIHKYLVINDIPDIEIGDYVKYFKVGVMSGDYTLNGGNASR